MPGPGSPAPRPLCVQGYSDGSVYALAGGTADHATVAINLVYDLRDALGAGRCRDYNADVAARLSPTEYRFPMHVSPGMRGIAGR